VSSIDPREMHIILGSGVVSMHRLILLIMMVMMMMMMMVMMNGLSAGHPAVAAHPKGKVR